MIGITFAIILIALYPHDETISSWKIVQPLRWCGVRCYSIYLMHWPVCKAFRTILDEAELGDWVVWWPLVTVPVSLLVGHFFYLAVERHFIGQRVRKQKPAPKGAAHPVVQEFAASIEPSK